MFWKSILLQSYFYEQNILTQFFLLESNLRMRKLHRPKKVKIIINLMSI